MIDESSACRVITLFDTFYRMLRTAWYLKDSSMSFNA